MKFSKNKLLTATVVHTHGYARIDSKQKWLENLYGSQKQKI